MSNFVSLPLRNYILTIKKINQPKDISRFQVVKKYTTDIIITLICLIIIEITIVMTIQIGRYDILYPQFKVPIQIMLIELCSHTGQDRTTYIVQGGQNLFVRVFKKIMHLCFDEKISPSLKVCAKFNHYKLTLKAC